MVTEGSLQMLSTLGGESIRERNPVLQRRNVEDDLGKELEFILREQRSEEINDREMELILYRSGSAPPTVEGSLTAVGGLFNCTNTEFSEIEKTSNGFLSEEEILSDPAYLRYYYSNSNLNPRLPPPTVSKEDWRVARRFQAGSSSFGGFEDRKKLDLVDDGSCKSLFSLQPGLAIYKEENGSIERRKLSQRNLSRQPSAEWLERGADGLIGLSGVGLGARRKSLADIVQEDLGRSTSVSGQLSCPASRNAFDVGMDPLGVAEAQLAQLHNGVEALNGLCSGMTSRGLVRVQSFGSSTSPSFARALGSSLSRSTTPDPQLVRRSSSPCLPPVGGRVCAMDKKKIIGPNAYNGVSLCMAEHAGVASALSGLSLSKNRLLDEENHLQPQLQQEFGADHNFLFNMTNGHCKNQQEEQIRNSETESLPVPNISKPAYIDFTNNGILNDFNVSKIASDVQVDLPKRTSNLYSKTPSVLSAVNFEGSIVRYKNADIANTGFSDYCSTGFSINQMAPSMMNHHLGLGDLPLVNNDSAILNGSVEGQSLNRNRNQLRTRPQVPVMDHPLYVQYLQRTAEYAAQACLPPFLAHQKSQYSVPHSSKSGALNHGYYGRPAFGLGVVYPGSPISNPVLPSVGPGSAIRHSERVPRFPSVIRSSTGVVGSWYSENGGNMEENFGSSLLEEFKSNKTRCFELSEIVDHVVEFSVDQYGSRFIQQKLETATFEEKNVIFPEMIPHARSLMTDVFGNYVIQKFFEHGTESQIKELASQLSGHVLALSLQMYGCRVIQKALEVVDVEKQTQMVLELDGHVMRCVRDQNGNHVIQKCIECVPQIQIQFIISAFYEQVVALSTHPYGCRVIQRVLEHCNDAKTQQIMMEEILQSVCTLAQDQYGNYVVQHVLQHGKPHERSTIIKKLAGQIVQMSQQKFASNVVEKCLTFGGPEERQLLVNEMLGTTDENEPLQAMMKDQFANYVVQKVLETCDDQHRELILSRIKVHLNALKRYTYGKHIVARVEKLIAAGERHIGVSSPYLS